MLRWKQEWYTSSIQAKQQQYSAKDATDGDMLYGLSGVKTTKLRLLMNSFILPNMSEMNLWQKKTFT
jgi:hypothetical protein